MKRRWMTARGSNQLCTSQALAEDNDNSVGVSDCSSAAYIMPISKKIFACLLDMALLSI